jgi:hypothetical protein
VKAPHDSTRRVAAVGRRGGHGHERVVRRGGWATAAVAAIAVTAWLAPSAGALTIDETVTGTLGAGGWYRSAVSVSFAVTDPIGISATSGCDPVTLSADTASTTLTCSATNADASVTKSVSVTVRIDATPPVVTGATPERVADAVDWFNHPVTFSFAATDALSGPGLCSTASYGGPDAAGATVTGTCTDKAGNTGTGTFQFNYDATAPVLTGATAVAGTGAVRVRWATTTPGDTFVVTRSTEGSAPAEVHRGPGTGLVDRTAPTDQEHVYSIQAVDAAGNASPIVTALALPVVLSLAKSGATPRVDVPPHLRWHKHPRASYYHVQLFLRGTRIFAAWPRRAQLDIPASWTWRGHRYRLQPGKTYRWFLWAGLGERSAARYIRLGKGRFTAAAPAGPQLASASRR